MRKLEAVLGINLFEWEEIIQFFGCGWGFYLFFDGSRGAVVGDSGFEIWIVGVRCDLWRQLI